MDLVSELLNKLNNDQSIYLNKWSQNQQSFINDLNLITNKPMLYICNVDEKSINNGNKFSQKIIEKAKKESSHYVLVSAAIESQIAELDNDKDKYELLKELGLQETTLNKVIYEGYNLLKLITFFTSGPKETRAWTVIENATAPEAAGKIHSDFEKGFIRAETISYDDFINLNGELGCRESGKLRQERKDYVVKDWDIFHFLFNV